MFNYLVPWQLGGPLERFKSQPCWHYLPRTHPYNAILGTARCQSRVGASLTKLCRDLGRRRNGMRHCHSNCQLLQLLLQLQACCGCNYVNYGNAKFKLQVARGNVASVAPATSASKAMRFLAPHVSLHLFSAAAAAAEAT